MARVAAAALLAGTLLVLGVLVWQGVTAGGNPDPLAAQAAPTSGVLYIGVLVFREGLECILVLAAVTAGMATSADTYRQPIIAGAAAALGSTVLTWFAAILVLDDLTTKISALTLQVVTGLLAIVVLLVVMNWFFHKVYWTGWISAHTKRKQYLLQQARSHGEKLRWGFILLGFTSVYREGFEVVLFLQGYRLKLGSRPVYAGVAVGALLAGIVAVLTFMAHQRLPYRRMLVLTGILLGGVLLVMVGEQAQEMQLAHWLPKTDIPGLAKLIPPWVGLWFSVFPSVETLSAQGIAVALVLGSYIVASWETPRSGDSGAR